MNPAGTLRVAFLTSADSYRGSAVSLMHLAHGFGARGAEVRVITGSDAVAVPLRAQGVSVTQLDLSSTSWRTARAVRATLADAGATVLFTDRPRDLRLGFLATVGSTVALINRYNAHAPRPPSGLLARIAYRVKVSETVFLTHEMAKRVLTLAPWMRRAPHRIIPEGVDDVKFRPDADAGAAFRARHGLGDAPFLLAVGALTREKRGEFLLDAVRGVDEAPMLIFCGEGPLQESLMTHAARLGVQVRFFGLFPRDELRGAYNAAAVLVHACRVETFGLVVLEAMACGCPVVGVRDGGLLEVVGTDGDAGLLVDPDDPAGMARAIERLRHDARLSARLGAAARARAQSRFALSTMIDGYERAALGA